MSELNIDWAAAARAENGQIVATGTDSEYSAMFYIGKVPNFDGTDYIELPHLRLQSPGNTKTVYDQPARLESFPTRPSDPERFPVQWAAFKRGENMSGNGTPLEEWEGITPADVRRLDILGVHTVEQLAMVADGHLDGLGFGGRMIREKARAFMSGRGGPERENAKLKEQVADQSEQIGKLTDVVQALLAKLGEPTMLDSEPEPAEQPAPTPRGRRAAQQEA